ncbi:hypothetical protein L950_0203120 [Sphingobacterium sp. IITKGP-BTPF85]|nr:hypothetical protein L950_0203120 [Sphingobacterium sp. IITKGP-BTPF85]
MVLLLTTKVIIKNSQKESFFINLQFYFNNVIRYYNVEGSHANFKSMIKLIKLLTKEENAQGE